MSPSDPPAPVPANRTTAGDTVARDRASVNAWGELLAAARITAAEQDLDLRYLAVMEQPGGPDMTGIIGRFDTDVYDAPVAGRLVAIKRGAIESGRPRQGRVDLPYGGGVRSFEVTATPRRNEHGTIIGVLSVAVDLTEVLRFQQQRPPAQARLAGVLDGATDAIISAGPDQKVVFFNPAAEHMFGVPVAEALGADVGRFVTLTTKDEHSTFMRRIAESGLTGRRVQIGALRAVRGTGEAFPVDASISHTGSGADQLFTFIIRDRTEDDQLQAQRLQAQKLEGIARLAGGVAHDFNNLLTVILGYCELLRMRQHSGIELEEINSAARRASELTRQLLAFSRRQVLQVETLDLNGLILGLNRMLRRITGENVVLETELADDALWVVADVGQMEQVLLNLVVNARDAMPHGGTLRIATRRVDHVTPEDGGPGPRSVEVTVTDSGVGMTDDVRSRIFEPFFTTKGDEATGLGLASVYGIVTQTGGDIVCESAVGQGTRFRVSLPAAPPPREASPASTALGHGAHGREIVLLVEDESSVRELTARALREFGYKVLEAPDVDSALRYLEHPGLAVVVSDVVMPGRSGDDLSTEVMRRRPDLPVLLMTGCSEALLQRPVDPAHLLRKPFTPTDLVAKIRALLDRAPATSA
jgi:two-component system cell cycle sensor histidine kinase/response regulator CckA